MKLRDFDRLLKLGSGTEGTVYRARQISLGRYVTLKEYTCRSATRRRQVADTLGRLSSMKTGIIPSILGSFHHRGNLWVVSEYTEGITLDNLNASVLPLQSRLYILAALSEALDSLHGQSLVHGDIKPSNILLTSEGEVCLIDFGFSGSADRNSLTGVTPAYMAPELLCDGESDAIRAENHSFGIVAYELITFSRHNSHCVYTEPEPVFPRAVPQDLADIIIGCLSFDPQLRPQKLSSHSVRASLNEDGAHLRRLTAHITLLSRTRMAALLVQAAAQNKNCSMRYSLLVEAIGYDSDNAEAIDLLERCPPSGRTSRPVGLYALAALAPLLALSMAGLALFSSRIKDRHGLPVVPAYHSVQEMITPLRHPDRMNASGGEGMFLEKDEPPRKMATVSMKKAGRNVVLYCNSIEVESRQTLSIASGLNHFRLQRGGDTLWSAAINVLPYEKLILDPETLVR